MTIRLTVDRARWWSHVTSVAASVDGLVPVVKGNGYGFGRAALAKLATELGPVIAVGNVHELDGLPPECTPVVLTPTLQPPPTADAILTIGNQRHVDSLADWRGGVIVKLESSMHRYGNGTQLVERARASGLRPIGVAIHPPLAGSDDDHSHDIARWLPEIDPELDVWVSHLAPESYAALPTSHRYKLRAGTHLWHGDRQALHLEADVLDTRHVSAGTRAGYRLHELHSDGTVVMIGAGSANGLALLPGDLSPFHFAQRRLAMIEPPHMHTSMAFVPDGEPCPQVGDWVDVQRPLTMTTIDELSWR
jgi:alanine racemase